MKNFKRIIPILIIVVLLLTSVSVFADDNADSGSGDTTSALKDKGFYRGSEYMYKISVYVGLSDKANKNSDLQAEWKMVGSCPIYVKPESFTLATNVMGGSKNKVSYLSVFSSLKSILDLPVSILTSIALITSGRLSL
ncbi:MAG: hypothetical protein U9N10_04665 [Bacillota bacterium]|nr:hypothetical protein [Bacillota bacterium]